MKSILKTWALLCGLALTQPVFAAGYAIEVLIFSRDNGSIYAESWPTPATPPATGTVYSERSSGSFFLKNTAARISAAPGMRILAHRAWSQPVYRSNESQPAAISGGNLMPDGYHEVEGTITLGRGKYLHFKPNLQLRRTITLDDGSTRTITAILDQPRRMKSREAHYIDHPLFGIIVYASPL